MYKYEIIREEFFPGAIDDFRALMHERYQLQPEFNSGFLFLQGERTPSDYPPKTARWEVTLGGSFEQRGYILARQLPSGITKIQFAYYSKFKPIGPQFDMEYANAILQPVDPASKSYETVGADFKAEDIHSPITILFLAADPTDTSRLRLGEEYREIQERIKLAKLRDHFKLELPQLAVRPADISQALLDTQPQIVHFSGHGTSSGALCFENQVGRMHPIEPDALANLFEYFANQVNCVVLNACHSEIQANAIAKHIDFVIGTNKDIGDKAAIAFTIGFYQALGGGRTIEDAFKLGCVQIGLQGIPEHLTPVLIKKGQVQP